MVEWQKDLGKSSPSPRQNSGKIRQKCPKQAFRSSRNSPESHISDKNVKWFSHIENQYDNSLES